MDVIDGLKAFVATAQTGSFTAAADHLGISNRLTSKYVAELELQLGVPLFQRTTRRVGLTPAGEGLLTRAPALLDELEDLLADASVGSRGISGLVRISAPVTFGEIYVAGMLARFVEANPNVRVDLRLNDKHVDLASEGIDLAFRIGRTDMLSLKTRKLGEIRTVLVANPDYLARHGVPRTPEDIARHVCIVDSNRRHPREWVLAKDGVTETIHVESRFMVNSARAASELAAQGIGIAFSPRFAVCDDLKSGRLVTLLEDHIGEANPVSAVYLSGRRLPRKIRALVEFAATDIRSANLL